MGRIKTLIIFPIAALYLPVVTRGKGTDDLVLYPMCFQALLEEGRLVPIRSKAVGELRSIIRLDARDGEGERFYEVFHKLRGRIGAVFLKGFHEAPSGILVNGSVLEELLPDDPAVFEAGGRDEFHIHLNTLAGILHLLIGLGDVLWIGRMDGHDAPFFEEAVESGDGAGIAALPELDPEDDQSGIRVAAAHIRDKLSLLRVMLAGVMVRPSGAVTQGIHGAVKAAFPAVDILPVGLVFDSGLGDAMVLSVSDQG